MQWIAALIFTFLTSTILVGLVAFGLSYLPRIQWLVGPRVKDMVARAPVLDIIVATLTWVPWVYGFVNAGWLGIPVALAGQAVAMYGWVAWHEYQHRDAFNGPTIFRTLNRIVGIWPNHAALWVTLIALPGFWFIRLSQVVAYPFLVLLLRFPRYKQGEWINVSRQKFEGLIGHDLIWCLYCDWMTGVYSLGAEMLRNVESFWCPIRFYDGKKCENCTSIFPDIDGGWVRADGTMKEVTDKLEEQYGDGRREWFGHPVRLTIKGK